MRFALEGRGKRGGARMPYVQAPHDERVYLLLAYPKNVRESLTKGEKSALKKWVETL